MHARHGHPRGAVHAYLDGELSLEGSLEVEEHLEHCEPCRRELETLRALRPALRSARETAPVRKPVLAGVSTEFRARQRRRFGVSGAVAVAATLAAVLFFPWRGVDEAAAAHARAVGDGRTLELASRDPAAIESWLAARLREFVPPAPGGDGFALRGARVDALGGRPVATVVYEVRTHLVGVSAWRSSEADSEPRPTVAGPWTVCRWAHGGVAYWMVSDAGIDELKTLASLIKSSRT